MDNPNNQDTSGTGMDSPNKTSYYVFTVCPYLGKCKSEGTLCSSCANNQQDHYIPIQPYPYIPVYPPTITWVKA